MGLIRFYLFLILRIAFLTLMERHILGLSQIRLGPNKTLFIGLTQPILDAFKLFHKEVIWLYYSRDYIYLFGPLFIHLVFYMYWIVRPYYFSYQFLGTSSLFFMCLVGFTVYTFFFMGYYSGRKFSYLGAMRSTVQSLRFEVSFFFLVLSYFFLIYYFQFILRISFFYFLIFILWLFFVLVEVGRAPIDFREAESELVRGYNLEYGGIFFVILFLREYGFLIFFSSLTRSLFLNWIGSLRIKFFLILWLLVFLRSTLPRYRYDKLMYLFWRKLLPFTMIMLLYYFIFSKI